MNVGIRIKQARLNMGWSQPELARACGWSSQSRISQYEQGKREPKYADIVILSEKLRVSIGWLLGGKVQDEKEQKEVIEARTRSTSLSLPNSLHDFSNKQKRFLNSLAQAIFDGRIDDESLEILDKMSSKLMKSNNKSSHHGKHGTVELNVPFIRDYESIQPLEPGVHAVSRDKYHELVANMEKAKRQGEEIVEILPEEGIDGRLVLVDGTILLNLLETIRAI